MCSERLNRTNCPYPRRCRWTRPIKWKKWTLHSRRCVLQASFITTEWTDVKSESNWQPLPLYSNNKNPTTGIWIQQKCSVTCRSSVTLWSAPAALKHKTTVRCWGSCALRSAQRQQAWSTAPGWTQLMSMTVHSDVKTRIFLLALIFVKIVLVCYKKSTAMSLYFSTVRSTHRWEASLMDDWNPRRRRGKLCIFIWSWTFPLIQISVSVVIKGGVNTAWLCGCNTEILSCVCQVARLANGDCDGQQAARDAPCRRCDASRGESAPQRADGPTEQTVLRRPHQHPVHISNCHRSMQMQETVFLIRSYIWQDIVYVKKKKFKKTNFELWFKSGFVVLVSGDHGESEGCHSFPPECCK